MALSLFFVLIISLFSGIQAQSQIINVPAGDTAALIQAINDANAAPNAATINLGGGTYILNAVDNTKNGDNGLPSIVEDATINGNGSIIERSTNPGTPLFRIIHIGTQGDGQPDPNVTLNDLTIRNGFTGNTGGGGILHVGDGTVNINDCVVSDNMAEDAQAAGINNDNLGTMNIARTTITRNIGDDQGFGVGGVINDSRGVMNITESTVYDNVGRFGGGVGNNSGGTLNMLNTTVSGNMTNDDIEFSAGGVYNNSGGDMFIDSSTITDNGGETGGNVGNNSSGSVFLINTIVGESLEGTSCIDRPGNGGFIVSQGYNIDRGATCGFNTIGDKSNTNPQLGPLQNNGGPTDTHLLLGSSPAIDMGKIPCPPPATDQRGVERPIGNRCDIGAVEVNPVQIPTLSEWGLIAMAAILGFIGFIVIRGRKATA